MPEPLPITDEELIARFQGGDQKAYDLLVLRYRDRLMTFLFRFLGSMDEAEDLVQETFVRLYHHRHAYRTIARFSTWIYTIASNLARTELRKRKRRRISWLSQMGVDRNHDYEIPANVTADEYAEEQFAGRAIQKAIEKLPEHFREALVLRDIQELSYEEVSKILGVPLGTVKSRINRARLQLQEDLRIFRPEGRRPS